MSILFSTEGMEAYLADSNDLEKIIEIETHPENYDYTWHNTKEEYLELIENKSLYLTTFRKKGQSKIMGYSIMVYDSKADSLELRRMAVMEKNNGYGQEIIQGIKKFAFTDLNAHRLWLDVFTFNYRAIYIYEKLNFKRERTLRDIYKDHRGYHSQHIYSMLSSEYSSEKTSQP